MASAFNYNLGAEIAIEKWRFRTGLILQSSPFDIDSGERDRIYSAGIGFRANRFFIDLAWRGSQSTEAYIPYTVNDTDRLQQVNIDKTINKFIVTTGFKF